MSEENFPDALPQGHRLHWYVLERVLGQGGFGITYLAHDTNLDRRVAIKEYLPAEVARRRSDASARPSTESHAERFAWGLDRFISEARTLARFEHPNIVRVLSIFEANSTAYMVMRFEEGEDLGTLLRRRGTLPQKELVEVLMPVLAGLQLIHSSGFIHRDIKPENIYVREDGSPVVLDFGSARQSFGSAKTMTILVAPGYAPLEQYYGDAKTQGPWTDIYGLAATCYRAVTGRAPLDAIARAKGVLGSTRDLLEPAAALAEGLYDGHLLTAIDHALQLSERDRPQSIAEWRREIVAPTMNTVQPAAGEPSHRGAQLDSSPPTRALAEAPATGAALTVRPESDKGSGDAAAPSLTVSWTTLRWGAAALVCAAAVIAFVGLRQPSTSSSDAVVAAVPQKPPVDRAAPSAAVVPPVRAVASVPSPTTNSAETTPAPLATTAGLPLQGASRIERATARDVSSPDVKTAVRDGGTKEPKTAPSRSVALAAPAALPARSDALGLAPGVVTPAAHPSLRSAPAASATATTAALPPPTLTASVAPATVVAAAQPSTMSSSRRRDEQLDTAEAALRRGDAVAAAQIASSWAAAGVPRAQTLLGRAQEARSKEQRSDLEAYVWYSIAARGGEPAAPALRDKVAGRLQPAELRQAEQIIERWKPHGDGAAESGTERSPP